jgi:hypothetical protein
MSDDLQDLRVKITARAHKVLLAKSNATGKDFSVLVRDLLDAWAADEVHAATLMARLLRSEGLLGELEGHPKGIAANRGGKPSPAAEL